MHFKNQILIFSRKVLVIQLGDLGFELLRFMGNFAHSTETAQEFFSTLRYVSV